MINARKWGRGESWAASSRAWTTASGLNTQVAPTYAPGYVRQRGAVRLVNLGRRPPDDVEDSSRMGAVTAMLLDRGLSESDVRKILGGNAQRVLEVGWKPVRLQEPSPPAA